MYRFCFLCLVFLFSAKLLAAGGEFTDEPRERDFAYPSWFKQSFLNLPDDLSVAVASGKKGIAVYFGQKHCAYCEALMKTISTKPDINKYFRDNYDVIPLDIWGNREVKLLNGDVLDEREYSVLEDTNFTPSLLFYNEEGKLIFKMRGYYKPYRFRAMLIYMVEGFYQQETFREYMDRADAAPKFDLADLNEHDLFSKFMPILDRRFNSAQKPLAVIFEQSNCHACDQFHTTPLNDEKNLKLLNDFEIHQLDIDSDTPLITPSGDKINAQQWANNLDINYYPSMVFFDELGKEVIRIDSLVKLYRLRGVLQYIVTGGYKRFPTYQRWRRYSSEQR